MEAQVSKELGLYRHLSESVQELRDSKIGTQAEKVG